MQLVKEEIRLGAIKRCLKEKSILVVDDDLNWSQALVKLLEGLGANVSSANDGPACIRYLRSINFDLVLLDINMPDIDGWDVFAMMKNVLNGRQVPVLILTGLSKEGVAEHLARLPIPENQVLQKNTPPENILQSIYKILQD